MPSIKLVASAVASAALATLPAAPASAAGPLLAPWALGHLIGAAARLATLPLVAASAASAGPAPASYAAAPAYNTAPRPYYSAPPGYYSAPGYYPRPAYYAAPVPYYAPPRPLPATSFGAGPSSALPDRFPQPRRGYYAPGMRYSASYGGQVFSRARAFAYRRW